MSQLENASMARERARAALIKKFRSTAAGRLEHLNLALLELETDPDRQGTVETAMREIHTLKGEARLLGFTDLNTVAHKTEEVMYIAKEQGFRSLGKVFDLILKGFDTMQQLLHVEDDGEDDGDEPGLVVDKYSFEVDTVVLAQPSIDAETRTTEPERQAPSARKPEKGGGSDLAITRLMKIHTADHILIDQHKLEHLTDMVGDLVQDHGQREGLEDQLRTLTESWQEELQRIQTLARKLREEPREREETSDGSRGQLLMRLDAQRGRVTELRTVLERMREATFEGKLQLADLETRFREVRMQPLSSLFGPFPRAVRDLGRELGKEVRLDLHGEAVEVDQRILERFREPLLHLIRNSVDHAIESPSARRQAAKPEEGCIRLQAVQKGPYVRFRISDDGKGLDPQEIVRSALSQGLVTKEEASELGPEAILRLVFRPGFSTRDQATDISGRGVGLDVVRTEVEALGGSVVIKSEVGVGTTFDLTVPISAAFQRVLLFDEGAGTYAVPATSVVRLLRIPRRELRVAAGSLVFDLESEVLPVIAASHLLGLGGGESQPADDGASVTLVVLGHGTSRIGLQVQQLVGERSLVRQKLNSFLDCQSLIAGSAAFGDGGGVLLLSVPELVSRGRSAVQTPARRDTRPRPEKQHRVLIVDDSELTRVVILEILRGLGYRSFEATNGKQAVEFLAKEGVDLILLDLDMPVLSGFETLAALRGNERTSSIPVIVLSAHGSDEDQKRCLELGADAYLVKAAFREADLVGTLRRFLA